MSEHEFKTGQLIVPNDDIMSAFYYKENDTELIPGVQYREATSAEFIWWNKKRSMEPMDGGVESYKKSKGGDVSKVYESIEKEKVNRKKQSQS
jgi:hypothetical protein